MRRSSVSMKSYRDDSSVSQPLPRTTKMDLLAQGQRNDVLSQAGAARTQQRGSPLAASVAGCSAVWIGIVL